MQSGFFISINTKKAKLSLQEELSTQLLSS